MIEVPMKSLLETGVHFGHQPRRWNPKMDPYIFTERKGVHIIDLQQTIERFRQVTEMITQRVADGEVILFVGTKRQASDSLEEHARRCGMPFVNRRWLGGTLTNFKTIRKSVDKLRELEKMEEENIMDRLSNKEARQKQREKNRLERNLSGIREMESLPDMIFVTDVVAEEIAVLEARKLDIPVIAIIDTNCDPDLIDYGIPGNDDAIRALALYSKVIADAVLEGKKIQQKRIAEEQAALQAEKVAEQEIESEAEILAPDDEPELESPEDAIEEEATEDREVSEAADSAEESEEDEEETEESEAAAEEVVKTV
ncbi:MAG: 30S ribosomal protein S2 [bacterium]